MTTLTSSGTSTSTPCPSRRGGRGAAAGFVFVVGLWLAALQVGLFLSLELLLSSAFLTFVVLLLGWLVGAAAGVWITDRRWTVPLLWASGLAPYASALLLRAAPYEVGLVWLHGVLIATTALFAGHIFQRERDSFERTGTLFFWENTGFTVGLVFAMLGFVLAGRVFLHAAPAVGLAVVLAIDAARGWTPARQA